MGRGEGEDREGAKGGSGNGACRERKREEEMEVQRKGRNGVCREQEERKRNCCHTISQLMSHMHICVHIKCTHTHVQCI